MKLVPKMSKETKQTLLAGIAGGLIFHMEEAANGLVAGYPQVLKDRINPNLPRNGQIVADVAPLAVGWALDKSRPSPRNNNIKMGLTLFDLPKLMHQIVWNVAYTAGRPAGVGLPLYKTPVASMPIAVRPVPMNYAPSAPSYIPMAGTGRYAQSANSSSSNPQGIGKYR